MDQFDTMEAYITYVTAIMTDFFQSGFNTVHESAMEELEQAVSMAEQYGLEYLAHLLSSFLEKAGMRRHRMKQEDDRMAEVYVEICEYLDLCRKKIGYDRGEAYYTGEEMES